MSFTIAATKANLIKTKRSLAFTREAHELLDEKRRILMHELTSILYITENIERESDAKLQEAYKILDKAVVAMGKRRVEEISFSIDINNDISISNKRVMGVNIPLIELDVKDNPPYCSPYGVSLYLDEAILKFKEALNLLAQLAEKRITLLRIAEEVRKTIRKVNALEKIYIPDFENILKYIGDRLDEEGRNSFSTMKMIKLRLGR